MGNNTIRTLLLVSPVMPLPIKNNNDNNKYSTVLLNKMYGNTVLTFLGLSLCSMIFFKK